MRRRPAPREGVAGSTRQPAGSPECESVGAKQRGSAGAKRPPSELQSGSLSAPACGGSPCRGCDHIVSVPLVPPYGVQAGLTHQDLWRLRAAKKRCGAPLRDGRPCVSLLRAHSLESTAPASAASFTARQADDRKIRRPQPGTGVHAEHGFATTPRVRRSADASLVSGKDGGSMGEVRGAGINQLQTSVPLSSCSRRRASTQVSAFDAAVLFARLQRATPTSAKCLRKLAWMAACAAMTVARV